MVWLFPPSARLTSVDERHDHTIRCMIGAFTIGQSTSAMSRLGITDLRAGQSAFVTIRQCAYNTLVNSITPSNNNSNNSNNNNTHWTCMIISLLSTISTLYQSTHFILYISAASRILHSISRSHIAPTICPHGSDYALRLNQHSLHQNRVTI